MSSYYCIVNEGITMKLGRTIALASVAFLTLSTGAFAQSAADAKATFSGGSVAAGVGFTWGSGTLTFQGQPYPFTVHGLSVADVGIAKIDGSGDVYNLKNVGDFAGTYVAAGAGVTIAGGGSVVALENQNGVIVHFHSTTEGLKLNLSASGVAVSLK
jgi:hypothetical protein